TSGFSTGRRVSPRWPFCPPGFLPDRSRKLLTRGSRGGFFSPSLEGGLLLLVLFNPSRRSSSPMRSFCPALSHSNAATRAFSAAFSACKAAFSCSSSLGGSIPALIQIRHRGTRQIAAAESIGRSCARWTGTPKNRERHQGQPGQSRVGRLSDI